jgi:hypothetical protein
MCEGRDSRMTQQSEADDKGGDAAEDVATHGTSKYRQDLPGEGKADPRRAIGIDTVLVQGPSLQPKGATPMEMRTDLARLESAFPAFSFSICKGWDGPRFEAWRDTALSGLYAIITDDPCELWRELNMAVR